MNANEFVKSQIDIWGFDYVEDLFAKGLEPTLVTENGVDKWVWLYVSANKLAVANN
jgi:hypothetical protein